MPEFICHCTVNMYDLGLKASTTSRPTILVSARDQRAAEDRAIKMLKKRYSDNKTKVTSVLVELIKKAE